MSEKNILVIVFGLMGGVFALIGAVFIGISYNASAEAARVGAMTPLAAEQLADLPDGSEVIVEGRISERNTALLEGLVAFTERLYRGIECDNDNSDSCHQVWDETRSATPALWLDIPGGRLRLSNSDYQLNNPPESWQTTPTLIDNETLEISGFRMGNPVFAAGQISAGDGVTLHADFIFGGTQADYLADRQDESFGFFLFGAIFGGIGVFLAIVGVVLAVVM
jgi:hypothetical protein